MQSRSVFVTEMSHCYAFLHNSKVHIGTTPYLCSLPKTHVCGISVDDFHICISLTSAVTACRSCLRGGTRWRAGQPNLRAGARALQHAWQLLAPHFSQTEAVGPPALLPRLMRSARVAPVFSPGWAPCLPPQARLLRIRWVVGNYWLSNCFAEQNSIIDTELAARLLPYKY